MEFNPLHNKSEPYDFSKVNNSAFGRHVRVEKGKDGQNIVKLDSRLGKTVREALSQMGLRKGGGYVKDLNEKIKILNSLDIDNPNNLKISRILAKDIVKDNNFHTAFNKGAVALGKDASALVEIAQGKLYEKLKNSPLVEVLIRSYYTGLNEKPLTTNDILRHLEEKGVDLKKERIDGGKFVEKLVEKKYSELPDDLKVPLNKEITQEIKNALRNEITDRFQNAAILESLATSKKDMNTVMGEYSHLIKDDYTDLIEVLEKEHISESKTQTEALKRMIEVSPLVKVLFDNITERSSSVISKQFEGKREEVGNAIVLRHLNSE
nr:hypothetical protein [Parachlamydiaceae bacterium]